MDGGSIGLAQMFFYIYDVNVKQKKEKRSLYHYAHITTHATDARKPRGEAQGSATLDARLERYLKPRLPALKQDTRDVFKEGKSRICTDRQCQCFHHENCLYVCMYYTK